MELNNAEEKNEDKLIIDSNIYILSSDIINNDIKIKNMININKMLKIIKIEKGKMCIHDKI